MTRLIRLRKYPISYLVLPRASRRRDRTHVNHGNGAATFFRQANGAGVNVSPIGPDRWVASARQADYAQEFSMLAQV